MNIKNGLALSAMLVIGYVTYAMQPTEPGESSAMAEARGATRESSTLQQIAAESIARQIHDQKKTSFMLKGDEVRLDELAPQFRDLVAGAYYRLYRNTFKPSFESVISQDEMLLGTLSDGSYITYETIQNEETPGWGHDHVYRWVRRGDSFEFSQELLVVHSDDSGLLPLIVTASADSSLLAIGYDESIYIYAKDGNDQFNKIQRISVDINRNNVGHLALSNDALAVYYGMQRTLEIPEGLVIYTLNDAKQFARTQSIPYEDPELGGGRIGTVTFDVTGRYFAYTCIDGTVKIWSRDAGTMHFTLKETLQPDPHEATKSDGIVVFSPNNKFIAYGYEKRVVIWQMASDGEITQMHDFYVESKNVVISGLSFNHDSNWLVAVGMPNSFVLWAFNRMIDKWYYMHTQEGYYSTVQFVATDFMLAQSSFNLQLWWVPDFWNILGDSQKSLEKTAGASKIGASE